jgi:hypothetical protein
LKRLYSHPKTIAQKTELKKGAMINPTPLLTSLATPLDIGFGEPPIIHKHKALDFVDKIQSIDHIITKFKINHKS